MKFSAWKLLNENLTKTFLSQEANLFKKHIGEDFYAVVDFETFKRHGEPVQHNILFTNTQLQTFAVNYTTAGKLFSVDIWEPKNSKPFVTYYVTKGSAEEVAPLIRNVIEDPKKEVDMKKRLSSAKVLQESEKEESAELVPEEPKQTLPVSKKNEEPEYDYGDPDTVFSDLETYVDMIITGTQPSLLITGSPGVGKTHTVLHQLKEAGLEKEKDYIHVKGRSTALGMYTTLYENNGKLIIFDDCDSVFGNPDAVNILKGALDSSEERTISWLVGRPIKGTDGTNVPTKFVFTGKVIFISNKRQKDIDDAIKSRSFILEVALSPEDMLKYMRKKLPEFSPNIPLPIKEEAMDFIEEVSQTAENLELNMRTLVKSIKILKAVPNRKICERLIAQQCSYK